MKTADQATKFADVAEQKMPLVVSARLFVPTEAAGSLPIKGRTLTGGPEPKLAATKLPLPALLPGALPLPEPLDGLRAAPALDAVSGPANAAERLQARISEQVGELRHFSADSMAVIIKPDARTEIFLRLQLQGGLVDVHARFDRGDFGALNAHWGEIQQALSHQGIKLGSLETPAGVPLLQDSAALAAFGQSNPDKQSRQHRAALPEFAESSGDLALAGSAAEPLPRRHRLAAMTRSRWESWA